MADLYGIEAATATLRQLLTDHVRDATVTARPLDAKPEGPPPFLNLFLYRVTEHPQLRDGDLNERPGQVPQHTHPALSLDLHYLLTAAGSSNGEDLAAHRALGDAMLVLHNNSIISRDNPSLDARLADGVELIRIILEPVSLDDLSKLWTAATAPFRVSVGYQVTMVMLESAPQRTNAKPIHEPPMTEPTV